MSSQLEEQLAAQKTKNTLEIEDENIALQREEFLLGIQKDPPIDTSIKHVFSPYYWWVI